MHLQIIIDALERIAPLQYAEPWDNVGLLAGDPNQKITGIMLCIDLTTEILAEAAANHCNLIIAYHPPIFKPVTRLTANNIVFSAIQKNIAIYSPHTALDCAPGGVNDVLAEILELKQITPLRLTTLTNQYFKLITFVPKNALDKVSNALFTAGAGHIGNYSHCSFQTEGTGTFLGAAGTNPTIGKPGQLEQTDETRFETIIPAHLMQKVVSALFQSHPYEEPAFDLIPLTIIPNKVGQGRMGTLSSPTSVTEIISRVKQQLNIINALLAGPMNKIITRVACLAGAGGEFIDDAIAQGVDLFLTGEIRHHDALKAANAGLTVISTLHSNSERVVLPVLQQKIIELCPNLKILISKTDKDPMKVI